MSDNSAKSNVEKGTPEPTLRRKIINWLGYGAVLALILYSFAPESWWQFGVAPVSQRKASPAFRATDLDGGKWDLAEHRGQVVVINYWATWCPPCRFETPGLVRFAKTYKDRGVDIVGVNMDDDRSAVAPFVASYEIKYPILFPAENSDLSDGATALPTTYLIDKQGRLSKKYTGIVLESTLSSDVDRLLQEQ
jgi:thiol-disulfide isomerase/thioredoxin